MNLNPIAARAKKAVGTYGIAKEGVQVMTIGILKTGISTWP
jgi:hypothetical protein